VKERIGNQETSVEPKTYSKEQHGIEIEQIDQKALYILEKLRASGFTAYLVGGSVRDLLLKQHPKDFDISTSAKPEEIKALFPSCILIGKRFRLAHIRFGRKIIEVSTFRAGNIEREELITEDNIWGTAEEDAVRRDFTINGLFYDSHNQSIIDYVGGYPDIEKKYLRAIGQPYLRFKQDPVRMIRCIKFQARFGLEVDKDAELALIECKQEITKSAQARILEELLRMLESGSACPFVKLMTDYGILQELLPEIAEFLETAEGEGIYAYLTEADATVKEPKEPKLARPVLLGCITFPILEKRLKTHFFDRDKIPHLGEIYTETLELLNTIFHPFFRIPRRLRLYVVDILVSQYRITPFEKFKKRKIRIPNIPHFGFSLQFLRLRCRLEPGLQEIATLWEDHYARQKEWEPRKRLPYQKRRV
jgi:poly(A) polymerase